MKHQNRLAGVLPVFQTSFHEDETIDLVTLGQEIDWLFGQGADGIVMAMASETLRLSSEERDELAAAACRFAAGRGPVVISVGAESTSVAVRHAWHAQACGASAVMAIPPIATACDDTQLLAYFRRLLLTIDLPLIVQDASAYVGRRLPIEMSAQLLNEFGPDRVLFKPEAVPIGPCLTALRDATHGRARMFDGSGGIGLVDSFRRGVVGTMPGADLIRAVVALWRALVANNDVRIAELEPLLRDLVSLQSGLDGFIAIEKHLLVRQKVFSNTVMRGPVGFQLNQETRAEVDRRFTRLMTALGKEQNG